MVDQHIPLFSLNSRDSRQHSYSLSHFLFESFGDHHFRLNIHLPAGQFRGQARVLPALANRQGKLVFADRNSDPLIGLINLKCFQLRRRQGIGNEISDIRVPADDIHLLVVQLANNVFDPLAAQSDAGPDRIDFFVTGPNGQLGPKTGLAGDAFYFDGAIVDFRYFELEEFDDETGVRTRQNDFRTMRALFDRFDITANPLADLIFLGGHSLPVWEQGLVFAQIHNDIR